MKSHCLTTYLNIKSTTSYIYAYELSMNDSYKSYRAEDFAADEKFIQWVMGDDTHHSQWEEWLNANPELRPEVETAKRLLQSLSFKNPVKISIDKDELWNKIDLATEEENEHAPVIELRRKTHPVWYILPVAAAATIAILLIINIWGSEKVVKKTQRGAHYTQLLPDGSKVELNAESEITWDNNTWDKQRIITLTGEAFFDVKKGAEFTVNTSQGIVTVLGTSFNVYQRGNKFEVKCVTGKVGVSKTNDTSQEILLPGEGVRLNENLTFTKTQFESEVELGWRQNAYNYINTPLGEILDEVERQYDVEISAGEEIREIPFTIDFEKNVLDSTLYMICWPNQLEYQINNADSSVVITKMQ